MLNQPIVLDKKSLRRDFRIIIKDIANRTQQSEAVSKSLRELLIKQFPNGGQIAAFAPDELEVCWHLGFHDGDPWKFYFPKMIGSNLEFFPSNIEYLKKCLIHYSLQDQYIRGIAASSFDAILVPGLAYSVSGQRLGRGGGFYDRWLLKHESALKVGLTFVENLTESLPIEEHDQSLDVVISSHDIYINKELE